MSTIYASEMSHLTSVDISISDGGNGGDGGSGSGSCAVMPVEMTTVAKVIEIDKI